MAIGGYGLKRGTVSAKIPDTPAETGVSEYLWNEHCIQISYGALRLLYKRYGVKHRKARRMRKSLIRDE